MGLLKFIKCILLHCSLFQIRNSSLLIDTTFLSLFLLCCPRWMRFFPDICLTVYRFFQSNIKCKGMSCSYSTVYFKTCKNRNKLSAFGTYTTRELWEALSKSLNISLSIFFRLLGYNWNSFIVPASKGFMLASLSKFNWNKINILSCFKICYVLVLIRHSIPYFITYYTIKIHLLIRRKHTYLHCLCVCIYI